MFENYHEKEFFICISLGGFTWSPPLVYDRKRSSFFLFLFCPKISTY